MSSELKEATRPLPPALPDEEVVRRVLDGETALFELLMRRYNQRVYRVARSIVHDDDEAEDVVQQAYLSAYANLGQFAGQASFATWLTRIAINGALGRVQQRARRAEVTLAEHDPDGDELLVSGWRTPEEHALGRELRGRIEEAVDRLPALYRTVFMMREVQHLDVTETSSCLEISEVNVKVRLHRAKAMLRDVLGREVEREAGGAFPFLGARCDRLVENVLAELR